MSDGQSEGDACESVENASLRKRLLQGIGGASVVGSAGCLGGEEEDDEPADDQVDDGVDEPEDDEPEDDEPGDGDPDDGLEGDAESWLRDPEEHGWEPDPGAATDWDNYELTELAQIDNVLRIDVDPDGRVWYITRGAHHETHGDEVAEVGWVDPDSGDHEVVLELDVIVGTEDHPDLPEADAGEVSPVADVGGQSLAVDPDFEDNGYVYINYTPPGDEIDLIENPYHEDILTGLQRVSRFEMGDDGELDPDSEVVVLEIPVQLMTCCHVAGDLEFGPGGDLYISTGDNANNAGNPDDEIRWFMGDERQDYVHGRPAAVADAQRTSANTADLRGSILRIRPTEDGGYEIPDGNLQDVYEETFDVDVDDEEVLPEIHSIGFRNPYAISVDAHTGLLWVSDYSPGGAAWEDDLGPMGMPTHHLVDEPIFGGWPYFQGYYPVRYYDFEADESGQPFWIDNVRNRSPNNTGREQLPDFTPATVWHSYDWEDYVNAPAWVDMPRPGEPTWPELPPGGSANAGVAYRYADHYGEGALDPYFEGRQFVLSPFQAQGWMGSIGFDADGSVDIEEFLTPDHFELPMDMGALPDGRVIVVDYNSWEGEGSAMYLVEYHG